MKKLVIAILSLMSLGGFVVMAEDAAAPATPAPAAPAGGRKARAS